jgi:hypothetical protein
LGVFLSRNKVHPCYWGSVSRSNTPFLSLFFRFVLIYSIFFFF